MMTFRISALSLLFLCLYHFTYSQIGKYKVGDVCNIKYKEFGLGEWHDYQNDAFFLSYYEAFNENDVLIFTSEKDCPTELCDYRISIHSTSGYHMLDRFDTTWKTTIKPEFHTVFNRFIVTYETMRHSESESSKYNIPEADLNGLHYFVDEGVIRPLHELNKSKLRHLRHEILSEKGHKYHASEITEYFLHRHKWRHVNTEEIHSVFNESELFLLKGITDLIYKH